MRLRNILLPWTTSSYFFSYQVSYLNKQKQADVTVRQSITPMGLRNVFTCHNSVLRNINFILDNFRHSIYFLLGHGSHPPTPIPNHFILCLFYSFVLTVWSRSCGLLNLDLCFQIFLIGELEGLLESDWHVDYTPYKYCQN